MVQGDFLSSPSLLQAGLYRSGADIQLDTCGTSVNEYSYFMEYKVSGVNGYHCGTYGVAATLAVDFYGVYAYPSDGSGEWAWAILHPNDAGFSGFEPIGGNTAIPMVGDELNNDVGTQCQASSSATGAFYAYPWNSLADNWYGYFSTNGGNPQAITSPYTPTSWKPPTQVFGTSRTFRSTRRRSPTPRTPTAIPTTEMAKRMSNQALAALLRRKRLLLGGVITVSAALLLLILGSDHQAAARTQIPAAEIDAAAVIVQSAIPGSTSTLVPASANPAGNAGIPGPGTPSTSASTGAEQLQITIPASALTPTGSSNAALASSASPGTEATDSAVEELGWHAALAAGLAGVGNTNIVSYTVGVVGQTLTAADQASVQGLIRTTVGGPENGTLSNIGAVPYHTLLAQLQSNLEVLEGVLPPGTVLASDAFGVPLNAAADDYGFEVDLKVSSLASLQGYVGDIVNGLGSGLTGGPAAPSEGLAINLVDTQGRRAGWWTAGRAGSGSAIGDPVLSVSGGTETTTFPNLTGGPAPTAFASGAPAARATFKATGYPLHPTRGIGPVSIGEAKIRVERSFNVKTGACAHPCLRTYRSKRGVLHVNFRNGRVNEIKSTSPQITLYGIPLGAGVRRLKKTLRHWTYVSCHGYIYGPGPSTSISFHRSHRVEINVVSTQLTGCGLP